MSRLTDALAEAIDALLPQTQCRLCGYAGCRPYAEAVATGEAGFDQCPPGGDEGAARLAELLELPPKPVDRRYGIPGPPLAAWIDEARCIGCTLCIQACPVDAIVGASRHMHTVITRECTGCGLCLPPCPVECIVMRASPARPEPRHARARFEARARRLRRAHEAQAAKAEAQAAADAERKKHETIARAVARARARLERHPRR